MAQLSDDCFAFGGALMTVAAALAEIGRRVGPVAAAETVPLAACSGRILAGDVTALRSVPPHDNSAVDGYAVHFDDLDPESETRLPVAGRVAAGPGAVVPLARGAAARIFTGAPMPDGPDTVMMQEDCRVEGDAVVLRPGIRRGANRRRAGEDVRAGSVILRRGRRLRPQDLGLAAADGRTELSVRAPLRAAVFSTGAEVREPGTDLPPGCIYDANRRMLAALLAGLGARVDDLGILPDDAAAIGAALERAAADHDVVVTSGGVSTGDHDHVRAAVERAGRLHFWRLAIKPGRPVALGQLGRVPLVGLPGNPVAAMVTFLRLARPLILRLAGAEEPEPRLYPVSAGFAHRKKEGRREYLRARLDAGADGAWTAHRFPRDGAGILSSLVESDGLVELDEARTEVAAGETVAFLPFREMGL